MGSQTPKCTLPPRIPASQAVLSKKVKLPLEGLKAKFSSILAEYAKSIAEHRAEEPLEDCGLGTKNEESQD
jgi:hypothetical protein